MGNKADKSETRWHPTSVQTEDNQWSEECCALAMWLSKTHFKSIRAW